MPLFLNVNYQELQGSKQGREKKREKQKEQIKSNVHPLTNLNQMVTIIWRSYAGFNNKPMAKNHIIFFILILILSLTSH